MALTFTIPDDLEAQIRARLQEIAQQDWGEKANETNKIDLEKVTKELYKLAIALTENKVYLALQHKMPSKKYYLIYSLTAEGLERCYTFYFSPALGGEINPDKSGTYWAFRNFTPLALFFHDLGISNNIAEIESRLTANIL